MSGSTIDRPSNLPDDFGLPERPTARTPHISTASYGGKTVCYHNPVCTSAGDSSRFAAHVLAAHPEQGCNRLCNGGIAFDDSGGLLPEGHAIRPGPRRRLSGIRS